MDKVWNLDRNLDRLWNLIGHSFMVMQILIGVSAFIILIQNLDSFFLSIKSNASFFVASYTIIVYVSHIFDLCKPIRYRMNKEIIKNI